MQVWLECHPDRLVCCGPGGRPASGAHCSPAAGHGLLQRDRCARPARCCSQAPARRESMSVHMHTGQMCAERIRLEMLKLFL